MSNFLDIKSLIESDYYKSNNRLNWHINHLEYDNFTKDLFDWLLAFEFNEEEKEIFDISSIFIYTELASYLSHVYDFLYLTERNLSPVYSKQSNVYIDKIWKREVVQTALLIELEKDRFKFSYLKKLYAFFVKIIPKKFVQTLLVSSNELAEQYLLGIKGFRLKIIPHYHFKIDTRSSVFSVNLSKKISQIIVKNIESHYFTLNTDHKKSIEFIVDSYIARTYNNISSYSGFLSGFKKNANIITGTGNSYYNRLLSSILKKENLEVTRFNHGGERCFYEDNYYWEKGDLFQTDKYITYGIKWKYYLERILEKNINTKILAIGSNYHKEIYNKFFHRENQNNKKILYIPNSFIGEIRVFPYAKLIDPILFDWQKNLIEVLQSNGFDVIYKKHPKGFLQGENFLGKLAASESTKPMIEALEEADMVLCDMAGSAFIESLCAGKKIVLIDTLQRPFDVINKQELASAVKIIEAYWQGNILKIDENKLVDLFNNFDINREDMNKLVNDYYLSSE
jgi:hypothetical protein